MIYLLLILAGPALAQDSPAEEPETEECVDDDGQPCADEEWEPTAEEAAALDEVEALDAAFMDLTQSVGYVVAVLVMIGVVATGGS